MIYFDSTMLLLIPAIILAFYAQFKVRNSYRKYSQAAQAEDSRDTRRPGAFSTQTVSIT